MITVENLLKEKGVYYKAKGRDFLVRCWNPEHPDGSPSMRIDKNSGVFNCLSCGFHGNIYRYFNIELPKSFTHSNEVLNMIDNMLRVVKPMQIPESAVLFKDSYRNISPDTFIRHGAFTESTYQGFLMFPILDFKGRISMLQGRRMHSDMAPKYVFYPSSASPPIYPCHRGVQTLVLVEGLFDVLNLEDKGFAIPTSAVFGSATAKGTILDKLKVNLITGLRTVVLLLDNDEAGIKAAKDLQAVLRPKVNVLILNHLLGEQDPGELTAQQVQYLNNLVLAELDNITV